MIGIGYDMHRLSDGESLILGGVNIESSFGTVAHSDGDVLLHSIIDAVLGAAGLGDIGEHFPDTDPKYRNVSSVGLAREVYKLISNDGFELVNIDCVIVMEKPKLFPYKEQMRQNIADIFYLPSKRVNVKATTNEKLSFIGRSEGVVVHSVCQIEETS